MTRSLFIFGLGYTGLALAADAMSAGWMVRGTCRNASKQEALLEVGIHSHLFGRDAPLIDVGAALAGATHVLSTIPPDEWGDPVLDAHAGHFLGLRALVWTGYVSTTGVYGDRGGEWVDEASELRPTGLRGRRRVQAEGAWCALSNQAFPNHIFRVAGIYGPGRSSFDQLRAGTAHCVSKPGQVFSRIHVDDLVGVLRASMDRPCPGAVYNVCDDEPAAPADVMAHAARLLSVEPPPLVPFEQAQLSDLALSFYSDNKRVRNIRIKEELGVKLKYPDYRSGLAAILAEEASH